MLRCPSSWIDFPPGRVSRGDGRAGAGKLPELTTRQPDDLFSERKCSTRGKLEPQGFPRFPCHVSAVFWRIW